MRTELAAVLGEGRIADEADFGHYGRDWTRAHSPVPRAVVFPESIEHVQAIVRWANDRKMPLVPSGGRTGLSGGAVAPNGEIVVSMDRMRSILAFDGADRTLTVQAGVTTQQVQERARELGLFYPVDFASRGSAQIGGNVATNAGGIRVLRYGMTRNWVTGLRVVTGTGDLLVLNRGLVKNATGYDLRHLFVGSEGTLGIVVEAVLGLAELPLPQQVILLALPHMQALMPVFTAVRAKVKLSAFEFFTDIALKHVLAAGGRPPFEASAPFYVLAEFDANDAAALEVFEALTVEGLALDAIVGSSVAQNAELWRLREGITESIAGYRPYKNDVSVRISRAPEFMARAQALFEREYPGFEVIWFGHLGDGNLHVSILCPPDMETSEFQQECGRVTELLGRLLQEFGGSVSAEHGVGLLKKPYLHYTRSKAEIDLMRQMKRVFDPAGIMNPGKMLP
jgi:FAD/FMN-containing dehydrogenase